MAVVPAKIVDSTSAFGAVEIFWETLTDGDTGAPVDISNYTDLAFHSDGDYSGSATITLQGSNNAVAYFTLNVIVAGALASGSAVITADTVGGTIVDEPRYIRPSVNSGNGSTDIDLWIHAKKRSY